MGAALFDLKEPHKLVARGPCGEPLLVAKQPYELNGWMKKVVFPTGIVEEKDDKILLYCGGADSVVSVKEIKISEILKHLSSKYL